MPTLRQLRALHLLGQTRSFTRTADEMAVTQSAVSVMIRDLEAELGATLVERGRSIRLTQAGEALSACAGRALDDIGRTVADVRAGVDLQRGRLRIAVAPLSAATFFPAALALFASRYPGVTVEVVDSPVEQVSRLLLGEAVDAGIGSIDADPAMATLLEAEPLLRGRLWAVFPASRASRPATRKALSWAQLGSERLVLVGRVRGQWRDLFLKLADARIHVTVAYEVELYPTAIEMVRCGLGVALLPGYAATRLDPSRFAAHPLTQPATDWAVHWLARRGRQENPAARQMHRATREVLGAADERAGQQAPPDTGAPTAGTVMAAR